MPKQEVGRVKKNNVSLIEYDEGTLNYSDTFFVQVGVVGFYCTKKELQDLYTVLNCYINIDDISECTIKIKENGEEYGWMAL